jgi:hypothetical protein
VIAVCFIECLPFLSVMWLVVLLDPTNTDAAMYCGKDSITEGMTKLDVISKCGEPDLKEVASVNTFGLADRRAFRESTSAVEVWH